jgi:hypothetical protein
MFRTTHRPLSGALKLHKQPLVLHNAVEGCRTCSCRSARYLTTSNNCTSDNLPRLYAKPEAACAALGFLLMGGVSSETC